MPPRDPASHKAEQGSEHDSTVVVRDPVTEGFIKATGIGAASVVQPVDVLSACTQSMSKSEVCAGEQGSLSGPFPGPEWVALGLAIIAAVLVGSLATAFVAAIRKVAWPARARLMARHSAVTRPRG